MNWRKWLVVVTQLEHLAVFSFYWAKPLCLFVQHLRDTCANWVIHSSFSVSAGLTFTVL